MSFTLFAPDAGLQPDARKTSIVQHVPTSPVRSNPMNTLHDQHVQELQRERLRQAESYRLRRLALRARRAVAAQIVR
jgi:hypothetical protein